jgi:hypothetical protein
MYWMFDRVDDADYLSGDDAFKRDWMSRLRERRGCSSLDPWTLRGVLAISRHVGGRTMKKAVLWLSRWLRPLDAQARRFE